MAHSTMGWGIGWIVAVALSGLVVSELASAQTVDPTEPADPTEPVPGPATGPTPRPAPAPTAAEGQAAEGGGDGGGDAGDEDPPEPPAPEPPAPEPPAPEPEGPASEDDTEVLTPSTRPWLGEFGVGPNIWMLACGSTGVAGGFGCQASDAQTQIKMRQVVGYHFSGDGEGFAMGLSLEEAFGSGVFRFQPGARLWLDIPVVDGMAVYAAPYAQLGYALWRLSFGGFGSATAHFFNWQLGAKARVVLGDRWELSFTPIGFDWSANGDGMIWTYDISFGFGATF